MDLKKLVLLSAALPAFLLGAACGGDDDGPMRTDARQVDAIIEAVEQQDRDALRDMLQFTNVPCTKGANTATQPPCRDEADGTEVDVFVANECEAGWVRQDETDEVLDAVIAMEPAVYAAFNRPDGFYLEGSYAAVFEGDETRVEEEGLKRYVAMGVEGEGGLITGMAFGCGIDEPVHFLLPHRNEGFDDWLIEPRE